MLAILAALALGQTDPKAAHLLNAAEKHYRSLKSYSAILTVERGVDYQGVYQARLRWQAPSRFDLVGIPGPNQTGADAAFAQLCPDIYCDGTRVVAIDSKGMRSAAPFKGIDSIALFGGVLPWTGSTPVLGWLMGKSWKEMFAAPKDCKRSIDLYPSKAPGGERTVFVTYAMAEDVSLGGPSPVFDTKSPIVRSVSFRFGPRTGVVGYGDVRENPKFTTTVGVPPKR